MCACVYSLTFVSFALCEIYSDIEQALKDLERELVEFNDTVSIGIWEYRFCVNTSVCFYVCALFAIGTDVIEKMREELLVIVQNSIESVFPAEMSFDELINAVLRYVLIAASRTIAGRLHLHIYIYVYIYIWYLIFNAIRIPRG